jgi:pimeloyl-ACP methyl ester carboxylesterase
MSLPRAEPSNAHEARPAGVRGILKLPRLTRLMIFGDRQPLTRTPRDVGLDHEEASFAATDGVELKGWFIPSGDSLAPAVIFVHGWLWNRAGNAAGRVPFVDRDVDFLPAAKALHDAGFHVLLFDLSNHGESGKRLPLTMGRREARDFNGAVGYLRSRKDVDPDRIGALGASAGANTVIYAIPDGPPVKALLAVQPTRLPVFNRNFAREVLGPLGPAAARSTDVVYLLLRAPLPSRHDPAVPARELGATVVQYVQGTGDPWGEMGIVEEFSARTPHSLGVIRYPSTGRYEGYQYVSKEADQVAGFFTAQL